MITLDVPKRHLGLDVADGRSQHAGQVDAAPLPKRGWERLYVEHVQQADKGLTSTFL